MRRPQLPLTLASARASVSVRTPSVSRVSVTVNLSFSCSILLPAPSLLRSFRLPSSSLGESTLKGRLFHSLTHSLTHSTTSALGDRLRKRVAPTTPLPLHPRFNKSSFLPFALSAVLHSHNASPDDWVYRRFEQRHATFPQRHSRNLCTEPLARPSLSICAEHGRYRRPSASACVPSLRAFIFEQWFPGQRGVAVAHEPRC